MKIGFLGVGNMGSAILKGYVSNGKSKNDEFIIFNRTVDKAEKLRKHLMDEYNCKIYLAESKKELIDKADLIFIGVKPKDYKEVLTDITDVYDSKKICVSMAAGISIRYIKSFLGKDSKVVRIMPNTPAQIRMGVTSISKDDMISFEELEKVKRILDSIGVCIEVDESQIHSVIGASGSSPAYTYMYMDALIKEAEARGMNKKIAKRLVVNTVIGAANMLLMGDVEAEDLIKAVSSPGGTTVAALEVLRKNNFEDTVRGGFGAAVERSKEMER